MIKTSCKKIYSIIKNYITETINYLKNDKVVLVYLIGTAFNALLVRIITVNEIFTTTPIIADFIITAIIIYISSFLSQKAKHIYFIIMCFLSSIICIANIVYYSYYESFISVSFISFALTNRNTGDAKVVSEIISRVPIIFVYIWFPIVMIISIMKEKKQKKVTKLKKGFLWIFIAITFLLMSLKGVDYNRLYNQWNRAYLVKRFGVYLYQINDIVRSIEPKMITLFGSDKANKEISEYYNENSIQKSENKYTNIFKDKNVIAIHAESLQTVALNTSFNGIDVTPNLNKLKKEGLYFSNFYSQVSVGTSSDTEFTVATGLMPVNKSTVFIGYADRTYISMYNKLKDIGYYTFSMHANTGDFWNRNVMHKELGYDYFYDKESYKDVEGQSIGFGLSDKEFFLQSADYIENIWKEHDKFYGTLISLSNHTPFAYNELFGEYDTSMKVDDVTYPYMQNTKLGDYFVSVHYADEQLGLLIEELDKRGILEDTIIVIYGDHDARIAKKEWNRLYNYNYETNELYDEEDERYTEIDYYWYELNRKVPLIIWSKDSSFQNKYAREVTDVMGMYNVSATLGNMMGFNNEYSLGKDIFEAKDKNVVILPDGSFITNNVFYSDNKREYKLLQNVPIDENYISNLKEYTKKRLSISDSIILYDYFKKEDDSCEIKEGC